MKTWFSSPNGATVLSLTAYLTLLGRTFVDFRYLIPEQYPSADRSLVGLGILAFMAFLGSWVWARGSSPPDPVCRASRPPSFSPKPGTTLGQETFNWLPRYTHPPVPSYIDATVWPAMTRVQATMRLDHIALRSDVETCEGAPACLTYHRLSNSWVAPTNDAFLIRGHFGAEGQFIPEKVVGYGGSKDDRGVGSLKVMRLMMQDFRRQLSLRLEKEGRPIPVVRPTPKA